MAEVAPAPAAAPAKAPKKKAALRPKKAGPSVGELIVKAVSSSKERSGVSLPALKKALAAGGYDVEKNNSRVKLAVKKLVEKAVLLQTKGTGASGSFKLNKKQSEAKKIAPKAKKVAAKKPKKLAVKKSAAKKSPKKAPKKPAAKKSAAAKKSPKKPAAAKKSPKKPAAAKKPTKSPKKAKKPTTPKKTAKSPRKAKTVKPKCPNSYSNKLKSRQQQAGEPSTVQIAQVQSTAGKKTKQGNQVANSWEETKLDDDEEASSSGSSCTSGDDSDSDSDSSESDSNRSDASGRHQDAQPGGETQERNTRRPDEATKINPSKTRETAVKRKGNNAVTKHGKETEMATSTPDMRQDLGMNHKSTKTDTETKKRILASPDEGNSEKSKMRKTKVNDH
ncbi:histone H1-like [Clarias gariepinus]|uniref:histone H1-like n=1 Tax=Clarias gariepinus TaxID=13013 RepID=UPI00234C4872|nr:histone H1-like [Clarias gariepinus]